MQHNLARILARIERVPLAPIITNGISENIPRAIEICRADAPAHLRIAFETVFGVFVPEVEGAVAAGGAEGAVHGVEADGVDGEDVASVVDGIAAVAFEAEVVALVFVVDVLDGAAAFDTADREARAICKRADGSRLPFQRRLHCLVEVCRVLEVHDLDPAVCGADYEHFVAAHVHAVDAFFALYAGDWCGLPEVPVFDHLVPAAGDEHRTVAEHEGLDAADRLVVCSDLHCV